MNNNYDVLHENLYNQSIYDHEEVYITNSGFQENIENDHDLNIRLGRSNVPSLNENHILDSICSFTTLNEFNSANLTQIVFIPENDYENDDARSTLENQIVLLKLLLKKKQDYDRAKNDKSIKYPALDINHKDRDGHTLLYRSCYQGITEIVELIIEDKDIDLDLGERNGRSPLYAACKRPNVKIVNLLLKKGASVNSISTYNDRTALFPATYVGNLEITKALVNAGIDLYHTDRFGSRALYWSCVVGNFKIVEYLLEQYKNKDNKNNIDLSDNYVQNINHQDDNGDTALYAAVSNGYEEIIKLLLDYGANVNVVNKDSETPLYKAIHNLAGLHVEGELYIGAYLFSPFKIIEMLIEKGANVNQANNRGCTPLKIACDHSILRIVQILLKNNVDVNQTDSDGRSPLYFCSTNSNYHCVDIAINLIRAGANLNLCSRKYHRTALHQAAAIGNFDIITLLLDCNAHLTPIDKNGRTPEDIAWICGYSHCAEYLKRRRLWQRRKELYLIKTIPETSNDDTEGNNNHDHKKPTKLAQVILNHRNDETCHFIVTKIAKFL